MQKKPIAIASFLVLGVLGIAVAQDQGVQSVIGNVFLQDTTPGSPQAGHATISGTFRAGQVFVQQSSTSTIPVVGNSTAVGAGTAVAGSFTSAQQSGIGVRGTAVATAGSAIGVRGESRAASGVGVLGLATSASGDGAAIKGTATSSSAYAGLFEGQVRADKLGIGDSAGSNQLRVVGEPAGNVPIMYLRRGGSTGFGYEGAGIFVECVGSGNRAGATFYAVSSDDFSIGVNGEARGSGINTGIWGYAANGTANYAGRFSGNVTVTGTLSKGGGSFKIDHPLEPTRKYLYHSFVESPDMMNIYNGEVRTDGRGYATVTMPKWFQALNRDFRYQLTVIDDSDSGDFVQAKVVKRMKGNQFTLRTSKPSIGVSWQVTGIRQDRWADTNRIPVEEAKMPEEIGTYLHPEAYGLPEEAGSEYKLRSRISQNKHSRP